MKNLVLACLAACTLIAVVGCSDDKPMSTTTSSSATMSSDTKDMKH